MSETTRIAVIGLGEAGSLIAGGLRGAGATVVGFDPANPENPPVPVVASVAEAVYGADVVISINSSTASRKVAEQVAGIEVVGLAVTLLVEARHAADAVGRGGRSGGFRGGAGHGYRHHHLGARRAQA